MKAKARKTVTTNTESSIMMAEALGGSEPRPAVSKETAIDNYNKAGELIPEDAEQITLEKYQHVLSDSVHLIIQEVLQEHHVPFKLQQFQMLTLHALGSLNNVVLLSPTGTGKMMCVQGQIFFHLRDKNSRKDISLHERL